jgi:hypothetical protein
VAVLIYLLTAIYLGIPLGTLRRLVRRRSVTRHG